MNADYHLVSQAVTTKYHFAKLFCYLLSIFNHNSLDRAQVFEHQTVSCGYLEPSRVPTGEFSSPIGILASDTPVPKTVKYDERRLRKMASLTWRS